MPSNLSPFIFFGFSHGIPGKIKNAIDSYAISALVRDIFKLKICVKYANEKTDDII